MLFPPSFFHFASVSKRSKRSQTGSGPQPACSSAPSGGQNTQRDFRPPISRPLLSRRPAFLACVRLGQRPGHAIELPRADGQDQIPLPRYAAQVIGDRVQLRKVDRAGISAARSAEDIPTVFFSRAA